MAKYIDIDLARKAYVPLLEWMMDCGDFQMTLGDVFEDLAETCCEDDVVEIVRCKDCKHREYDGSPFCPWMCEIDGRNVPDDWFCADGERKEEEGDV